MRNLYTFLMTFLFAFQLNAQNQAANENAIEEVPDFNITLQHTTLVVSDFYESKRFYTEVLRLEDMHADWLPERQMFLSLGDNLELHVGEVPGVEIKPSSFNHFAMSVNDLDLFLDYLKGQGVSYGSLGDGKNFKVIKRPDGVSQTFFQDPDGYWLEVNDAN